MSYHLAVGLAGMRSAVAVAQQVDFLFRQPHAPLCSGLLPVVALTTLSTWRTCHSESHTPSARHSRELSLRYDCDTLRVRTYLLFLRQQRHHTVVAASYTAADHHRYALFAASLSVSSQLPQVAVVRRFRFLETHGVALS